jgi:hypothetical protein
MHFSENYFTIDRDSARHWVSDAGDEEGPVLSIKVESSMKAPEVETMALGKGTGAERDVGLRSSLH